MNWIRPPIRVVAVLASALLLFGIGAPAAFAATTTAPDGIAVIDTALPLAQAVSSLQRDAAVDLGPPRHHVMASLTAGISDISPQATLGSGSCLTVAANFTGPPEFTLASRDSTATYGSVAAFTSVVSGDVGQTSYLSGATRALSSNTRISVGLGGDLVTGGKVFTTGE